jgi:hypothetical protein
MFAAEASPEPALRPRRDRRTSARFVHSEPVQINGSPCIGRDISSNGLAVITGAAVRVGEIVRVSLPGDISDAVTTTHARVTRVDRRVGRSVIGLEFIN